MVLQGPSYIDVFDEVLQPMPRTAICLVTMGVLIPLLIFATGCSDQSSKDSADQDSPPNLLLIVAEDMGYSDLSMLGGEISTPHLDA